MGGIPSADQRLAIQIEPPANKIVLEGVRKRFALKGRAVVALAGIDLNIRAGEFFCIVGPSGCGKTTLLRILAGLETKSSGTIEVHRDLDARSETQARPLNSMISISQLITHCNLAR